MKTTRFGEFELSQLMLGTAQFGLPYGVANVSGQPSFEEVCAILEAAHEGGVNCLDTAPGYCQSEEVLGRALQASGLADEMIVVSKALRVADETATAREVEQIAEREVLGSLQRLHLGSLPICLIHAQENFRHLEALLKLKEKGLIKHVGCSANTPAGAREIVASSACEALQIPTNILDRRFSGGGILRAAKAQDIAVFVRSAYLQGLILMKPENVPDDLQAVVPALIQLRALAKENHLNIEELALRTVMGLDGLSCVVVGVESTRQMRRNIEIFGRALDDEVMQRAMNCSFDLPDLIFEPWRWQKRMPDADSR